MNHSGQMFLVSEKCPLNKEDKQRANTGRRLWKNHVYYTGEIKGMKGQFGSRAQSTGDPRSFPPPSPPEPTTHFACAFWTRSAADGGVTFVTLNLSSLLSSLVFPQLLTFSQEFTETQLHYSK